MDSSMIDDNELINNHQNNLSMIFIIMKDIIIMDEYGERKDYAWVVNLIETYKSPHYVHEDGRQNLQHNKQGKIDSRPWFNPEYDWDDEDGYAFCSREFS